MVRYVLRASGSPSQRPTTPPVLQASAPTDDTAILTEAGEADDMGGAYKTGLAQELSERDGKGMS